MDGRNGRNRSTTGRKHVDTRGMPSWLHVFRQYSLPFACSFPGTLTSFWSRGGSRPWWRCANPRLPAVGNLERRLLSFLCFQKETFLSIHDGFDGTWTPLIGRRIAKLVPTVCSSVTSVVDPGEVLQASRFSLSPVSLSFSRLVHTAYLLDGNGMRMMSRILSALGCRSE